MNPKVSIIVPVYNVERELVRCVKSLKNQTLSQVEIILVDDGSVDRSGEICDSFGREDPRVHVVHKQNEGQGIARNVGLDIAKGDYISFIDSDDYVEQSAYELIVKQLEEHAAQLCCFGYVQQDAEGRLGYQAVLSNHLYEKGRDLKQFMLHYFGDDPQDEHLRGVSACMSVFRRDLIEEHQIRFQSERKVYSEDTLFSLDYCRYVTKVIVLDQCFYHYCLKAGSFTKGYQKNKLELTLNLCEILKSYAEQYNIVTETEQRIAYVLWVSLMDSIKQESARWRTAGWNVIYSRVRQLCNEAPVRNMLQQLPVSSMNRKQRIFWQCVKHRWAGMAIILGYARAKRGL